MIMRAWRRLVPERRQAFSFGRLDVIAGRTAPRYLSRCALVEGHQHLRHVNRRPQRPHRVATFHSLLAEDRGLEQESPQLAVAAPDAVDGSK